MNLVDALFLDPAPFEIWIAIRGDLLKGSGTLNDPYDRYPVYRLPPSRQRLGG